MEDILKNPFIRALCEFKHSPRTDMARRLLNNKDFIVLAMFALGPIGLRELRSLARTWRKDRGDYERILDMYFTPHYGHTATDDTGAKRYGGPFSNARHVKYWWRCQEHQARTKNGRWRASSPVIPMQVFRNDLTQFGLARARQLLQCPEAPLKELLPPRDAAQETLEAVVGAVCGTLDHESDEEFDALMNRAGDLRDAGGTDFSKCDVDAIMRDPRVLASLRKSVEGAIGCFQQFGDPE